MFSPPFGVSYKLFCRPTWERPVEDTVKSYSEAYWDKFLIVLKPVFFVANFIKSTNHVPWHSMVEG